MRVVAGWHPARVEGAIAQLIRVADVVERREAVSMVEADPTDDRVLEAASAGAADVIVSDDGHLLRLGDWRGIPIRSPDALLRERGL